VVLEKLLYITKVSTPLVIVLSLTYEMFYFFGMGTSLSNTPLNTSDFLRGWLNWYPYIFGSVTGYIFLELTIRRLELWQTEEQIISSSSNPEALRRKRERPYVFGKYLGILFIFLFAILGEKFLYGFCFGLTILVSYFLGWVLQGSPWSISSSDLKKIFTFLIALIFLAAYSWKKGGDVHKNSETQTVYQVTSEKSTTPQKVIRIFDQWSLVHLNENNYAWVNHQSSTSIQFSADRAKFNGFGCNLWDKLCVKTKASQD
jgi:hypothetical protein